MWREPKWRFSELNITKDYLSKSRLLLRLKCTKFYKCQNTCLCLWGNYWSIILCRKHIFLGPPYTVSSTFVKHTKNKISSFVFIWSHFPWHLKVTSCAVSMILSIPNFESQVIGFRAFIYSELTLAACMNVTCRPAGLHHLPWWRGGRIQTTITFPFQRDSLVWQLCKHGGNWSVPILHEYHVIQQVNNLQCCWSGFPSSGF